ncbi:zinc-ribbon domain-containing protein [uncultured Paludibaculum sp.]|uniref:zinc-ribbon domain-containing protein n=1 Tax=uncultured Paludibaculum sp. TaxID=1765020 RepID=UPI002AAC34E9|nr:zinc-ribbon domain-containing protein [uncultured Paludibaculum sp.]
MFFLVGVQPVRRTLEDRAPERGHCAKCGFVSDMRHQSIRSYFTLFFVPVIPISKAEQVLTCVRCGTSYPPTYRGFPSGEGAETDPTKTVLLCPACSGKVRIPIKPDNSIRVTCPHCGDKFTVSINRP